MEEKKPPENRFLSRSYKSNHEKTSNRSKKAIKKYKNSKSGEVAKNAVSNTVQAVENIAQSSEANSSDEAAASIESKLVKSTTKKQYAKYKNRIEKKRSNNRFNQQDKTEENIISITDKRNKNIGSNNKNRFIHRKPNSDTGRNKKESKEEALPKKQKNTESAKKKKRKQQTLKKGKELTEEASVIKDTLDGSSEESIDEGVAKAEGKIIKAAAKKDYRTYKVKKLAKNTTQVSKSSKSVLRQKNRYKLANTRAEVAKKSASNMSQKAAQKKMYQKMHHYGNSKKLSGLKKAAKKTNKSARKKLANSLKEKVVLLVKKAALSIKAALTSKVALIAGAIVIILSLLFFVAILVMAIFGGTVSEISYLMTPEEATVIQQRYAEREIEYLEMITEEAEPYIDDVNATIAYDPVGHDPHELLALMNVLFHHQMNEDEDSSFTLDDDFIDEIIEEIITARYSFSKTTEEVPRTIVIPNYTGGEDRVITTMVTLTELRSRSQSINNIIAGASFDTPESTQEFINFIAEDAREIAEENDLYASVMMAQAILETGSGSSGLSSPPHFNLFGIKGTYNGEYVDMLTEEDDGTGNRYTVRDPFRSYPSYRESMEDYARVMLEQPRPGFYSPTYKSNTSSYREATQYLQGTYATDTQYASKLNNIIEQHNLTQYDTPSDRSQNENESQQDNDERIEIEREFGGNLLALTEYERELYERTLEFRGLMGTYDFPIKNNFDWEDNIVEPFGISWSEEDQERYTTDGLTIEVPRNENVHAPVSGSVIQANSNSVHIRSEGTLVFEIENIQNVNVSRGEAVRRGSVIGRTTTDHLLLNNRTSRRFSRDSPVNPQLIYNGHNPQPVNYSTHLSQMSFVPDSGDWIRPNGGPVTSEFGPRVHPITGEVGRMHNGIDIGGGGPILASRSGTVTTVSYDSGGYGYYVVIDHGDGYRSLYAHMQPNLPVIVGEQVDQGQVVGTMGTTGSSTGIHLHFEIHKDGSPQNPRDYVDF